MSHTTNPNPGLTDMSQGCTWNSTWPCALKPRKPPGHRPAIWPMAGRRSGCHWTASARARLSHPARLVCVETQKKGSATGSEIHLNFASNWPCQWGPLWVKRVLEVWSMVPRRVSPPCPKKDRNDPDLKMAAKRYAPCGVCRPLVMNNSENLRRICWIILKIGDDHERPSIFIVCSRKALG